MEDIEYIYSLRKYLITVAAIFILSLMTGLLVSIKNPEFSENYLEMFKQSFGWIKTLPPLAVMLLIFLNNAFKSLLALVLGLGLGIIPFLFVAGNGIIIGILGDTISRQHGTVFVVAALLPHGIIEIPMILISAGIGLRLGHVMYFSLIGMKAEIKQEMMQGARFYARIIVPMLFVAAMVETFVTPLIASLFAS